MFILLLLLIHSVSSVIIDVVHESEPSAHVKLVITDIQPSSLPKSGHQLSFSSLNDEYSILLKVIQRKKESVATWVNYKFTAYNEENDLLAFKPLTVMNDALYLSPQALKMAVNDGFVQYSDGFEMKEVQPLKHKRSFMCRRRKSGILINTEEMRKKESQMHKIVSIEAIFTEKEPVKQGIQLKGYDKKGNVVRPKWYEGDEKPSIYIKKNKNDEWKKYMLKEILCRKDKIVRVLPSIYVFEAKDGTAELKWTTSELVEACADERVAFKSGVIFDKKLTLITGEADPDIMEQTELDDMFAADQFNRNIYSDYEYEEDLEYYYSSLSRLLRYYESLRKRRKSVYT